jgi:hypothetical protein
MLIIFNTIIKSLFSHFNPELTYRTKRQNTAFRNDFTLYLFGVLVFFDRKILRNHRLRPQLMYLRPKLAFFAAVSFIFLRDSMTESRLTAIIAKRGHISAKTASFDSPFHALIKNKLSFLKL